jgi:hypothetical protein
MRYSAKRGSTRGSLQLLTSLAAAGLCMRAPPRL